MADGQRIQTTAAATTTTTAATTNRSTYFTGPVAQALFVASRRLVARRARESVSRLARLDRKLADVVVMVSIHLVRLGQLEKPTGNPTFSAGADPAHLAVCPTTVSVSSWQLSGRPAVQLEQPVVSNGNSRSRQSAVSSISSRHSVGTLRLLSSQLSLARQLPVGYGRLEATCSTHSSLRPALPAHTGEYGAFVRRTRARAAWMVDWRE